MLNNTNFKSTTTTTIVNTGRNDTNVQSIVLESGNLNTTTNGNILQTGSSSMQSFERNNVLVLRLWEGQSSSLDQLGGSDISLHMLETALVDDVRHSRRLLAQNAAADRSTNTTSFSAASYPQEVESVVESAGPHSLITKLEEIHPSWFTSGLDADRLRGSFISSPSTQLSAQTEEVNSSFLEDITSTTRFDVPQLNADASAEQTNNVGDLGSIFSQLDNILSSGLNNLSLSNVDPQRLEALRQMGSPELLHPVNVSIPSYDLGFTILEGIQVPVFNVINIIPHGALVALIPLFSRYALITLILSL